MIIEQKIALVIDEPEKARLQRRALEALGFDVDLLTGPDALDQLDEDDYKICIVFGLKTVLNLKHKIGEISKRRKDLDFLGIVETLSRQQKEFLEESGLSEVMADNAGDGELITRVHSLLKKRVPIRVLIIEDDEKTAQGIRFILERAGYTCFNAYNIEEANEKFRSEPMDVMTIDRRLRDRPAIGADTWDDSVRDGERPDSNGHQDGLNFLRAIRKKGVQTPALILTHWDQPKEKVEGLKEKADYMGKPFDPDELLARVELLLQPRIEEDRFVYGPLEVLKKHRIVRWRGEPVHTLNSRSITFEIFLYLIERPRLNIPKSMLLADVFECPQLQFDAGRVETGIARLRSALGEAGIPEDIISFVKRRDGNSGYCFNIDLLLDPKA